MITVHHLNNSRSQRVLWLLEELGLPYEIERYQRDPKTLLAPPSMKAIHPLGKSPIVTEGDRVLAESGAILEYIIERHGQGRLAPQPGTAEHLRYRYFMHYAEGSAMPPLLLLLVFNKIESARLPFFVKPIARGISRKVKQTFIHPNLENHIAFQEAELARHEWFAGSDFTAADIQMSFPVEAAEARGAVDERHPRLRGFLAKIRARPAYQRALERGGPFSLEI